jgi:hypothetical protein
MKAERDVQNEVLLECGHDGTTLFRQNVGQGWTGEATRITRRQTVALQPGDVVVRNARPLLAGLCVGSSDIIGFRSIEITAAMVGQRVAVFTALEVKAAKGRATEAQARFLTNVREAGGIAALVRSAEDAARALHGVD